MDSVSSWQSPSQPSLVPQTIANCRSHLGRGRCLISFFYRQAHHRGASLALLLIVPCLFAALANASEVSPFGLEGYGVYSLVAKPSYLYVAARGIHRRDLTKPEDGWTTIGLAGQAIYTIAADPLSTPTLYAGGEGIYKTTNAGGTWQESDTGIEPGATINKIAAVAEGGATRLFALSTGKSKLYRSTDGAASWQPVFPSQLMLDFAVCPSQPNVLYNLRKSMTMEESACLKSENGGTSWTLVSQLLQEQSWNIAVDPQNSGIVYVTGFGLQKSLDGGRSFQTIGPNAILAKIAIHPSEPGTIFFAGSFFDHFRIFESRSGGNPWRLIDEDTNRPGILCIACDPDNPRVAYLGVDGGVWRVQTPENWPETPLQARQWQIYK